MIGLWLVLACRTEPAIVDRVVDSSSERDELTLAYARKHTGPEQGLTIEPKMVVLHGTMDTDPEVHLKMLARPTLPGARDDLASAGRMNVAVHFLVDRGGTVYRTLPEDRYGRHTVGFNHTSIAIEHLGDGPEHAFTTEQIDATRKLVRDLTQRHPIEWLVGHHQLIDEPETHPLFLERDETYRTFALDPGDAFVQAIAEGNPELRTWP